MNRILIIESEQVNRKAVRDILAKKGFDVVTSPSGREGIRTVRESKGFIAVCIADKLTGLSGLDTLIAIRKYRPHIPVIMLMEDKGRENMLHATRRGASDFVHKPVKATELLLALRNTIEKIQLSSKIDRQLERLKLLEKSAGELTSIDMGDLAPEDVIR
ncbi:MAG: response regulator, partial [bacterium]